MQHRLWDARDDDAIIYMLRALVTGPARLSLVTDERRLMETRSCLS
jgi:hypothetical protein